MAEPLEEIVARSAARPVAAEIRAIADHVRAIRGPGVAAVLAYGSSLRDAKPGETLVDLYLLTDSLTAVSPNRIGQFACRWLPPNVHYAEMASGGETLRAKYAVMPLDLFERAVGPHASLPYFWARFAQPCRLLFARDEATRRRVEASLAAAVRRMVREGSLLSRGDAITLWQAVLMETYRSELRPEGATTRAAAIVDADADYYRAVTAAVLDEAASGQQRSSWRWRRLAGKAMSVLRLLKAAFTFEGGADYLAWKIARHSGTRIEVKPWHRRHPILGALALLPGLLRRGAVR